MPDLADAFEDEYDVGVAIYEARGRVSSSG